LQFINLQLYRTTQCSRRKFLIKVSLFYNLRLQGTSSLYVYKELRIKGTISHYPKKLVVSGVYCTYFVLKLWPLCQGTLRRKSLHSVTIFSSGQIYWTKGFKTPQQQTSHLAYYIWNTVYLVTYWAYVYIYTKWNGYYWTDLPVAHVRAPWAQHLVMVLVTVVYIIKLGVTLSLYDIQSTVDQVYCQVSKINMGLYNYLMLDFYKIMCVHHYTQNDVCNVVWKCV